MQEHAGISVVQPIWVTKRTRLPSIRSYSAMISKMGRLQERSCGFIKMGRHKLGKQRGTNGWKNDTILTKMFTKQTPQNLKSATVKIAYMAYTRKIHLIFCVGNSEHSDLPSKSLLSKDTQRPLVGKLVKVTDPKIGGICSRQRQKLPTSKKPLARVRLADLNGPKSTSSGQNWPKWTILV